MLDSTDVRRSFFAQLAEVFGLKELPESVRQADEEVRAWLRSGHARVFAGEPASLTYLLSCSPNFPILHLGRYGQAKNLLLVKLHGLEVYRVGVRLGKDDTLNLNTILNEYGKQDWIAYQTEDGRCSSIAPCQRRPTEPWLNAESCALFVDRGAQVEQFHISSGGRRCRIGVTLPCDVSAVARIPARPARRPLSGRRQH